MDGEDGYIDGQFLFSMWSKKFLFFVSFVLNYCNDFEQTV